jgi:hypothetical protein
MEFEKIIPAGPLDSDAGIAGDQDCEGPPCAQFHDTLPHIKRRYRKLALISLPRHFDDVCVRDDNTLFISCNWLLWQQNLAMGRHCIHYETLHDGSDPLNLSEERNLRAVDWVYRNNRDVTMFRGVSLGRKFTEEIAQLIAEWHRLERGLEAAIKRFHPEEIAFFDYKAKNNRLSPVGCLQLVRGVAARFDVGVIDRRDSSAAPGSDFSDERNLISTETRGGHGIKPVNFKFGLLSMFEKLAGHWSHLRRSRDGARLAILILATHRTVLPLIEGSWGSKLEPILFAQNFPNKKKVLHLLYSLARGILLISIPRGRLTHRELQAV